MAPAEILTTADAADSTVFYCQWLRCCSRRFHTAALTHDGEVRTQTVPERVRFFAAAKG